MRDRETERNAACDVVSVKNSRFGTLLPHARHAVCEGSNPADANALVAIEVANTAPKAAGSNNNALVNSSRANSNENEVARNRRLFAALSSSFTPQNNTIQAAHQSPAETEAAAGVPGFIGAHSGRVRRGWLSLRGSHGPAHDYSLQSQEQEQEPEQASASEREQLQQQQSSGALASDAFVFGPVPPPLARFDADSFLASLSNKNITTADTSSCADSAFGHDSAAFDPNTIGSKGGALSATRANTARTAAFDPADESSDVLAWLKAAATALDKNPSVNISKIKLQGAAAAELASRNQSLDSAANKNGDHSKYNRFGAGRRDGNGFGIGHGSRGVGSSYNIYDGDDGDDWDSQLQQQGDRERAKAAVAGGHAVWAARVNASKGTDDKATASAEVETEMPVINGDNTPSRGAGATDPGGLNASVGYTANADQSNTAKKNAKNTKTTNTMTGITVTVPAWVLRENDPQSQAAQAEVSQAALDAALATAPPDVLGRDGLPFSTPHNGLTFDAGHELAFPTELSGLLAPKDTNAVLYPPVSVAVALAPAPVGPSDSEPASPSANAGVQSGSVAVIYSESDNENQDESDEDEDEDEDYDDKCSSDKPVSTHTADNANIADVALEYLKAVSKYPNPSMPKPSFSEFGIATPEVLTPSSSPPLDDDESKNTNNTVEEPAMRSKIAKAASKAARKAAAASAAAAASKAHKDAEVAAAAAKAVTESNAKAESEATATAALDTASAPVSMPLRGLGRSNDEPLSSLMLSFPLPKRVIRAVLHAEAEQKKQAASGDSGAHGDGAGVDANDATATRLPVVAEENRPTHDSNEDDEVPIHAAASHCYPKHNSIMGNPPFQGGFASVSGFKSNKSGGFQDYDPLEAALSVNQGDYPYCDNTENDGNNEDGYSDTNHEQAPKTEANTSIGKVDATHVSSKPCTGTDKDKDKDFTSCSMDPTTWQPPLALRRNAKAAEAVALHRALIAIALSVAAEEEACAVTAANSAIATAAADAPAKLPAALGAESGDGAVAASQALVLVREQAKAKSIMFRISPNMIASLAQQHSNHSVADADAGSDVASLTELGVGEGIAGALGFKNNSTNNSGSHATTASSHADSVALSLPTDRSALLALARRYQVPVPPQLLLEPTATPSQTPHHGVANPIGCAVTNAVNDGAAGTVSTIRGHEANAGHGLWVAPTPYYPLANASSNSNNPGVVSSATHGQWQSQHRPELELATTLTVAPACTYVSSSTVAADGSTSTAVANATPLHTLSELEFRLILRHSDYPLALFSSSGRVAVSELDQARSLLQARVPAGAALGWAGPASAAAAAGAKVGLQWYITAPVYVLSMTEPIAEVEADAEADQASKPQALPENVLRDQRAPQELAEQQQQSRTQGPPRQRQPSEAERQEQRRSQLKAFIAGLTDRRRGSGHAVSGAKANGCFEAEAGHYFNSQPQPPSRGHSARRPGTAAGGGSVARELQWQQQQRQQQNWFNGAKLRPEPPTTAAIAGMGSTAPVSVAASSGAGIIGSKGALARVRRYLSKHASLTTPTNSDRNTDNSTNASSTTALVPSSAAAANNEVAVSSTNTGASVIVGAKTRVRPATAAARVGFTDAASNNVSKVQHQQLQMLADMNLAGTLNNANDNMPSTNDLDVEVQNDDDVDGSISVQTSPTNAASNTAIPKAGEHSRATLSADSEAAGAGGATVRIRRSTARVYPSTDVSSSRCAVTSQVHTSNGLSAQVTVMLLQQPQHAAGYSNTTSGGTLSERLGDTLSALQRNTKGLGANTVSDSINAGVPAVITVANNNTNASFKKNVNMANVGNVSTPVVNVSAGGNVTKWRWEGAARVTVPDALLRKAARLAAGDDSDSDTNATPNARRAAGANGSPCSECGCADGCDCELVAKHQHKLQWKRQPLQPTIKNTDTGSIVAGSASRSCDWRQPQRFWSRSSGSTGNTNEIPQQEQEQERVIIATEHAGTALSNSALAEPTYHHPQSVANTTPIASVNAPSNNTASATSASASNATTSPVNHGPVAAALAVLSPDISFPGLPCLPVSTAAARTPTSAVDSDDTGLLTNRKSASGIIVIRRDAKGRRSSSRAAADGVVSDDDGIRDSNNACVAVSGDADGDEAADDVSGSDADEQADEGETAFDSFMHSTLRPRSAVHTANNNTANNAAPNTAGNMTFAHGATVNPGALENANMVTGNPENINCGNGRFVKSSRPPSAVAFRAALLRNLPLADLPATLPSDSIDTQNVIDFSNTSAIEAAPGSGSCLPAQLVRVDPSPHIKEAGGGVSGGAGADITTDMDVNDETNHNRNDGDNDSGTNAAHDNNGIIDGTYVDYVDGIAVSPNAHMHDSNGRPVSARRRLSARPLSARPGSARPTSSRSYSRPGSNAAGALRPEQEQEKLHPLLRLLLEHARLSTTPTFAPHLSTRGGGGAGDGRRGRRQTNSSAGGQGHSQQAPSRLQSHLQSSNSNRDEGIYNEDDEEEDGAMAAYDNDGGVSARGVASAFASVANNANADSGGSGAGFGGHYSRPTSARVRPGSAAARNHSRPGSAAYGSNSRPGSAAHGHIQSQGVREQQPPLTARSVAGAVASCSSSSSVGVAVAAPRPPSARGSSRASYHQTDEQTDCAYGDNSFGGGKGMGKGSGKTAQSGNNEQVQTLIREVVSEAMPQLWPPPQFQLNTRFPTSFWWCRVQPQPQAQTQTDPQSQAQSQATETAESQTQQQEQQHLYSDSDNEECDNKTVDVNKSDVKATIAEVDGVRDIITEKQAMNSDEGGVSGEQGTDGGPMNTSSSENAEALETANVASTSDPGVVSKLGRQGVPMLSRPISGRRSHLIRPPLVDSNARIVPFSSNIINTNDANVASGESSVTSNSNAPFASASPVTVPGLPLSRRTMLSNSTSNSTGNSSHPANFSALPSTRTNRALTTPVTAAAGPLLTSHAAAGPSLADLLEHRFRSRTPFPGYVWGLTPHPRYGLHGARHRTLLSAEQRRAAGALAAAAAAAAEAARRRALLAANDNDKNKGNGDGDGDGTGNGADGANYRVDSDGGIYYDGSKYPRWNAGAEVDGDGGLTFNIDESGDIDPNYPWVLPWRVINKLLWIMDDVTTDDTGGVDPATGKATTTVEQATPGAGFESPLPRATTAVTSSAGPVGGGYGSYLGTSDNNAVSRSRTAGQLLMTEDGWLALGQPFVRLSDVLLANPYLTKSVFIAPESKNNSASSNDDASSSLSPNSRSAQSGSTGQYIPGTGVGLGGPAVLVHGWMVAWDTLWQQKGKEAVMAFIDSYDDKVRQRRRSMGIEL